MATAITHIPISVIRNTIQDIPKMAVESFSADGITTTFQLGEGPVFTSPQTSVRVNGVLTTLFTLNVDSSVLTFPTAPTGTVAITYFYTQLTDIQIENCLNFALQRHSPNVTWLNVLAREIPFIQILAVSSAFYALSARWAVKTRVRVETTEVAYEKISERYFQLGKQMEQQYQDLSAGIIDIHSVTRRDVFTGRLVPIVRGI